MNQTLGLNLGHAVLTNYPNFKLFFCFKFILFLSEYTVSTPAGQVFEKMDISHISTSQTSGHNCLAVYYLVFLKTFNYALQFWNIGLFSISRYFKTSSCTIHIFEYNVLLSESHSSSIMTEGCTMEICILCAFYIKELASQNKHLNCHVCSFLVML